MGDTFSKGSCKPGNTKNSDFFSSHPAALSSYIAGWFKTGALKVSLGNPWKCRFPGLAPDPLDLRLWVGPRIVCSQPGDSDTCYHWRTTGLEQSLVNFFCKGPESKYFRLCRPGGLCHYHSAQPWSWDGSHRQCVNGRMWLCSDKTVIVDTEN